MAAKALCYFCQRPITEPEEFLCPGCGIYICDREDSGCDHREGPFMKPGHRPEEHKLICGLCGNRDCDCQCPICSEPGCDDEGHREEHWGIDFRPQRPRLPTIEDGERALNMCAGDWAGHCSMVARRYIVAKLVDGEHRYGIFWGEISPRSRVFGGRPFSHHAWIERADRTIVDPTRWAFEARKPYVWSGWNSGEYDVGGSRLYKDDPLPKYLKGEQVVPLDLFDERRAKDFMMSLLGDPPALTFSLVYWLAHRHPDLLGDFAKPIYKAIIKAGEGVLIPIDFRVAILGKSE